MRGIFAAALCAGLFGCAAFGTKVRVTDPAALQSVQRVAVWPSLVVPLINRMDEKYPELVDTMLANDYLFREETLEYSKVTDQRVFGELKTAGLFDVVSADSVSAAILEKHPDFSPLNRSEWRDYRDFLDAEHIVTTKLSFGREGNGINTYVTLSLFNVESGMKVMETTFNTKWGKSYVFEQSVMKTLPDAVHGAVAGMTKEMRKQRQPSGK